MTGLEFKIYLFGFLAITVPLSIAFGFLRSIVACESTVEKFWEVVALFAICAVATYVFLLFTKWDDRLDVGWLFVYPIGLTLFVVAQAAVILVGTKLVGLVIPPKARSICMEYYFFTFAGAAALWNDLEKGENGKLFQLLQTLT